jgi:hypothetical protein
MEEKKRNNKPKINKFKFILKILFKKVKIWQLLLVVVLITANTLAWFIYASEVSNDINVHVRSWQINFKTDDNQNVQYVQFDIDEVYPGMADAYDSINIINDGEMAASMEYKIMSANILGTEYVSVDGRLDRGQTPNEDDMTSDELEDFLESNYPFSITFLTDRTNLGVGETGSYSMEITWPFESGDDATDTYWGNLAYSFQQAHPTQECIVVNVKLIVTQNR